MRQLVKVLPIANDVVALMQEIGEIHAPLASLAWK